MAPSDDIAHQSPARSIIQKERESQLSRGSSLVAGATMSRIPKISRDNGSALPSDFDPSSHAKFARAQASSTTATPVEHQERQSSPLTRTSEDQSRIPNEPFLWKPPETSVLPVLQRPVRVRVSEQDAQILQQASVLFNTLQKIRDVTKSSADYDLRGLPRHGNAIKYGYQKLRSSFALGADRGSCRYSVQHNGRFLSMILPHIGAEMNCDHVLHSLDDVEVFHHGNKKFSLREILWFAPMEQVHSICNSIGITKMPQCITTAQYTQQHLCLFRAKVLELMGLSQEVCDKVRSGSELKDFVNALGGRACPNDADKIQRSTEWLQPTPQQEKNMQIEQAARNIIDQAFAQAQTSVQRKNEQAQQQEAAERAELSERDRRTKHASDMLDRDANDSYYVALAQYKDTQQFTLNARDRFVVEAMDALLRLTPEQFVARSDTKRASTVTTDFTAGIFVRHMCSSTHRIPLDERFEPIKQVIESITGTTCGNITTIHTQVNPDAEQRDSMMRLILNGAPMALDAIVNLPYRSAELIFDNLLKAHREYQNLSESQIHQFAAQELARCKKSIDPEERALKFADIKRIIRDNGSNDHGFAKRIAELKSRSRDQRDTSGGSVYSSEKFNRLKEAVAKSLGASKELRARIAAGHGVTQLNSYSKTESMECKDRSGFRENCTIPFLSINPGISVKKSTSQGTQGIAFEATPQYATLDHGIPSSDVVNDVVPTKTQDTQSIPSLPEQKSLCEKHRVGIVGTVITLGAIATAGILVAHFAFKAI